MGKQIADKHMKDNNKKGMAIPIVLCVILCFGCYVASLSWSMSNSRARYEKTLNNRKAYFMARSGIEHMFLKIKTMQRHCYESMLTLERVPDDEKTIIYSVFTEDVIIPPDKKINYNGEKFDYKINNFKICNVDLESSSLTIELESLGVCGGYKNSIKRLIKISR